MAANMKHPKALINLGKCYLTATGTELSIEKARGLFKDAASLGEAQGRLEYIKSYIGSNLEDVATMQDLIESARQVLLENSNNAEALYIMGVFEERGIGVSPNKEASFHYIAAAARLEYPPALTRLGDYYYSGYFVGKNVENAKLLYEKAGEKGDSQALLNLAIMHDKGLMPYGSTLG
jgi:TPR repeat protein